MLALVLLTAPSDTDYNVILTLLTGTTTFNTENLSFRLPKPDVAYSVGVQAVNSVGNGETIFALDSKYLGSDNRAIVLYSASVV